MDFLASGRTTDSSAEAFAVNRALGGERRVLGLREVGPGLARAHALRGLVCAKRGIRHISANTTGRGGPCGCSPFPRSAPILGKYPVIQRQVLHRSVRREDARSSECLRRHVRAPRRGHVRAPRRGHHPRRLDSSRCPTSSQVRSSNDVRRDQGEPARPLVRSRAFRSRQGCG